jgi:hypothetical protein
LLQVSELRLWRSPAGNDDKIKTWRNLGAMGSDDLAQLPPEAIADHGAAQLFSRDQAKSEVHQPFLPKQGQDQKAAGLTLALRLHLGEVARLFKPQTGWQAHGSSSQPAD